MRFLRIMVFFCFFSVGSLSFAKEGYVSVDLEGQLGNQFFQIATAYAYALDHDLTLLIPDLVHNQKYSIPHNAKVLFNTKLAHQDLPFLPEKIWKEPSFNYEKIPDSSSILLKGYFQSDKYFKHRKKELLELFSPPEDLLHRILETYSFILSHPCVIGVQIRDYRQERPRGDYHPTLGRRYYEQAISHFPKDALFVVSSNNPSYAKECMEGLAEQVFYLPSKDYIEEFYLLTMCHGLISSNSSFGWWAGWLSNSVHRKVVVPKTWFSPPYNNRKMIKDLYPDGWTIVAIGKK